MDFCLIAQNAEVAADVANGFNELAPPIQVALFLGALSFLTALLVSITAFTRIVIVLSFIRRALATQEIPPNPVLLGLSVFLTIFVMAPTLESINDNGIQPFLASQKQVKAGEEPTFGYIELWQVASSELKVFMLGNTRESDLQLFLDLSNQNEPTELTDQVYEKMDLPLTVIVPSFIISELKTAFIMGFCLYIPFLLIDLVISTILMSLGMMMMPPVVVSTPCKLLLFVLVDGWQLITRALVSSFNVM
ncbi:MAG: flagellar type III secretion system pore protein FliP [Planctomycetota bacterium]